VQTELSRTLLAERIRSIGTPDNLMIWTPGDSLPLNWWEPDGFNKRRETGNREIFLGLVDQIKSHGISFVVLDPLSDFHSFPQADPEGARHMMSLFRYLANLCNCGVLVVHHHKKIGRNDSKYEGTDDYFGSMFLGAKIDTGMSMYAYTRGDGTSRYKLKFSKQRCSAPLPDQEINRIAQNDFFRWEAEDWHDNAETRVQDRDEAILAYLQDHPAGVSNDQAIQDLRMSRATWFRALDKLKKGKKIVKIGNLYSLSDTERETVPDYKHITH
jgi:RecA-family ATPase